LGGVDRSVTGVGLSVRDGGRRPSQPARTKRCRTAGCGRLAGASVRGGSQLLIVSKGARQVLVLKRIPM